MFSGSWASLEIGCNRPKWGCSWWIYSVEMRMIHKTFRVCPKKEDLKHELNTMCSKGDITSLWVCPRMWGFQHQAWEHQTDHNRYIMDLYTQQEDMGLLKVRKTRVIGNVNGGIWWPLLECAIFQQTQIIPARELTSYVFSSKVSIWG